MAYIYKITNQINGKVYIGKTLSTPEKRFKEHCHDAVSSRCEKRPLYDAMNKYGIENFFVETVEECLEDVVNEREIYWIETYGSFHNGYNATKGGDGKTYIDRQLVIKTYQEVQNRTKVAEILSIDAGTVSKILKENNIKMLSSKEVKTREQGKTVAMLDKETLEVINVFPSLSAAAKFLNKTGNSYTHIADVCSGKRITAYGYKWKFL